MPGVCTRPEGAAFAELICADDQWLREEFDALIAANFQPPRPPLPAPPRTPPLPPRRQAAAPWRVSGPDGQDLFIRPGSGLRRQRSPPCIFLATAGTTG